MTQAWTDEDLGWLSDHRDPLLYPPDRLAVASVVLSSLWLWFVGSMLGLILGLVALKRARTRPLPLTSRRWAIWGISLGLLGMVIFATVVAPPVTRAILRHNGDSAARASLADLVKVINSQPDRGVSSVRTSRIPSSPWTLPDGSGVVIVGPGTRSTGFKMVSTEVWDLWLPPPPVGRPTVYAAVLSDSGACFYLRASNTLEYVQRPPLSEPCTGDDARSLGWGL